MAIVELHKNNEHIIKIIWLFLLFFFSLLYFAIEVIFLEKIIACGHAWYLGSVIDADLDKGSCNLITNSCANRRIYRLK